MEEFLKMFKNFSKILMFLLFFVFLTVSTVSAEDNVTLDIDLNEENSNYLEIQDIDNGILGNFKSNNTLKASSSNSFKDLQNIIDNAHIGDTITLNKDYTYTTGDSPIFIGKSITIDGKNHIIDGKLATKILKIREEHVTIKNIKFINAKSINNDYGSAIDWNGDYANLQYCSFNNNHADYGGAISLSGTNGKISHCSFNNNTANRYGGAVSWYGGNGVLSGCSFNNNTAFFSGGAVEWSGANGFLSGCSFNNNHAAESSGGAVYWVGDNGFLSGCSFNNNHAAESSGGAVCWFGDNGFLSGCSFNNNTALNDDGGAVYWVGDNGFLSGCSFNNNHAAQWDGGAVYWFGAKGKLSGCSFVIFRSKNTSFLNIPNLIYYNGKDYDVDYYNNGVNINSGKLNNGVSFSGLNNNKYNITMKYMTDNGMMINYLIITGDSYLHAKNIAMFHNDGSSYVLKLTDAQGNPIKNQIIQITIANKNYNIKTNDKGYAQLKIKQKAGNYKITTKFKGNNQYSPTKIINTLKILKSPITQNKNMEIYYLGGTFKVKIIKNNGKNAGPGHKVQFTINGKTYTKKTNKEGYASIKITQKPKTYKITTQYKKYKTTNQIKIKPLLTAKNIIKKKTKITQFQAKLVNNKGKPQKQKTITFKINKKTYKAKTNKNGIATIKIKNLQKGKHTIHTQYTKSQIKNTIQIK
ncbi:bacterial Ig-like domain protein [Methanobrevibacter oralis]|uniref:Bacterial Ig-like domain protein n=2 Tax=Methanobrevibacter oralis TaxID=66851 RepID=A0A166C699_METOA|nr:bacterial Ig-like domain protein [Methanobrevibacter oralis]